MAFLRCLYQMEIERIKYILQSYFRTRLNKVNVHFILLLLMRID